MAKDNRENPAAKKAAWAKAANQAKGSWKSARKAKAGQFQEDPEIEDGTYFARLVNAKADFTKKSNVPFFRTTFVIVEGEYKGDKHSRMDFLTDDDDERQAAKQASFSKCMSGLGYDVEELEFPEIPQLAADLIKDKPYVEIYVRNWQTDNGHGTNIMVNRQLTEDEISGLDFTGDDDADTQSETPKGKPSGGAARKKAAPKGAGRRS